MTQRKPRAPHYQRWVHRESGQVYAVCLSKRPRLAAVFEVFGICGPFEPHTLPLETEWAKLEYRTGPEARQLQERQAEFIVHLMLPSAPRRRPPERA